MATTAGHFARSRSAQRRSASRTASRRTNLLLAKYVNPSRILERLLGLAEGVVIDRSACVEVGTMMTRN